MAKASLGPRAAVSANSREVAGPKTDWDLVLQCLTAGKLQGQTHWDLVLRAVSDSPSVLCPQNWTELSLPRI